MRFMVNDTAFPFARHTSSGGVPANAYDFEGDTMKTRIFFLILSMAVIGLPLFAATEPAHDSPVVV